MNKGPFIFYGIGGAGGIWGSVIWKLHDPLKLANFTQMTPPPPPPSKGIFLGDDPSPTPLSEKSYTWFFYTVRHLNISERNGASKKRKLKELIVGNQRTESTNALKTTSDACIASALQIHLPTSFSIVSFPSLILEVCINVEDVTTLLF